MDITADSIEDLFNHGGTVELASGEELTRDGLVQYIAACDIDTDDNGTPLDNQWQILADVLGAPDPSDVSELVAVTATTNALQEVAEAPYVVVLEENDDAVSIAIHDVNGDDTLDTTTIPTFGELGLQPGGLANPNVKQAALAWLRDNGWETIADPARILAGYADSLWRVTEPLPVRPAAATDELSHIAVAASRIGQAEEARDQAIRGALNAGHSVISIAKAAELSRARIYQIRDGRR